jgi:hypothetical protein
MTTETTAQNTQTTTETATREISVKHVESIRTTLVDQFPAIQIGHPVPPARNQRRKNWKAFFAALPIGGVVEVRTNREIRDFRSNAWNYDIKFTAKKQPGGITRLHRTA